VIGIWQVSGDCQIGQARERRARKLLFVLSGFEEKWWWNTSIDVEIERVASLY
jgi:hypothetical protein